MATTTYTALQTITVGAGGSSSIDFTVPSGYTDLLIKYNARSTTASTSAQCAIDINGNQTTSNYFWLVPFSNGATVSSSVAANSQSFADVTANTATANVFTSGELYISDYLKTKTRQITSFSGQENNDATAYLELSGQTFRQTAVVTAIRLRGTTFAQYSTFTLYGILATDAGAATTGVTPYVDFLIVAGGAGGGYGDTAVPNNNGGGGGGAGGILTGRYNTVASSAYTVTVGAGGSWGGNATTEGQNGFTSSFGNATYGTISASGGGGGGSGFGGSGTYAYAAGVAGASGGGASYASGQSRNGGASIRGQGKAGGANNTAKTCSGGGGGASANGTAGGQTGGGDPKGGNGGDGLAFTITGSSVTYAGGGGGGAYQGSGNTGLAGSGGTGGGGAGALYFGGTKLSGGTSGTANTGGGGGGGYQGATDIGSGGSGVIVLRYPVGYNAAASTTGSPTVTTDSTYRYYRFTGSGSITF